MAETSNCRRCQQTIFWHVSKGGKKYPCDSDNRRDFHKCTDQPKPQPEPPQAVTPSTQPASPASHIERRLQWLESEVRGLLIRMDALGS